MSNFRLNLPIDIPWNLIEVSSDMMDPTFCNKKGPSPWRSSVAVYAYEPKLEDTPDELCGQRLTYLKVSCSITGYVPSDEEIEKALAEFGEDPEVDHATLQRLANRYFACYGALLNVGVFPISDHDNFDNFPHIIDFEPKTRDFYQVASETGEILSTSTRRVGVGKSFMTASSTENSWQMGTSQTTPQAGGGSITTNGGTAGKQTDTDQLNISVQSDLSRERRELESTTTQLTQMYNLLSSYHTGTNRATFLMLPRPHLLQPTGHRTFVDGLRVMEGIQDFFIVVSRPKGEARMRFEVTLDTGHFPEDAEIISPEIDHVPKVVPITFVFDTVGGSFGTYETVQKHKDSLEKDGYVFNTDVGNSGMEFDGAFTFSEGVVESDIENHRFGTAGIDVSPEFNGRAYANVSIRKGLLASKGKITGNYKAHLKKTKQTDQIAISDPNRLLVTSRRLCGALETTNNCVRKFREYKVESPMGTYVVAEFLLSMINTPVVDDIHENWRHYRDLLNQIQRSMLSGPYKPGRYAFADVTYVDSIYFQKGLIKVLPARFLNTKVQSLGKVQADLLSDLPPDMTIRDLLVAEPASIAQKFKLTPVQFMKLRRQLLGGERLKN